MNYIVFGPENNIKHNNFSEVLKRNFGKKITLETLDGSNVFTVNKLVGSKSCLLKRVGYIQLNKDFEFEIKN